MRTVDIRDAKTNLSKLVEGTASSREGFVITRAGRPLVKVVPLEQGEKAKRRIGFLKYRFTVPDNVKEIGREEIAATFEGEE